MNKLIVVAALAGAMAAAAPAEQQPQKVVSDPSAAAIVADCAARKFETRVEIEKDGQKRLTKMKLCATKDADEASWVRTLQDAKAKIAAHPDISEESKAKIAAELDAEVAKIQSGSSAPILAPVAVAPPPPTPPTPALPPPLPTPAIPVSTAAVASPSPQAPTKPRLTIRCLDVGETGGGSPCTWLERETRLSIQADGDLPGSTKLRFLRRGDARGEVALANMRQGQSIRTRLPEQLCIGVSSSKVEIQVLSSNQLVETLGPYKLRC